ncbi:survival of motor neuron-related-splicing factor 30 isoform X2 [Ctenocephalides felis]|uniref:survival of motor neuron-related-splicing factor 30 isoform X2 n=1 Tax=Ctenocephalides felis TaxID=7515 RepID=UPI000E6E1F11|nr:survival of motor neuron-related-splicing factor 30 isoform X2 [Ctenocephalides felis]
MADDLQNYKLQLQQVEAALLTDPDNEELLKLKTDLEEVIDLTRDLIKSQLEVSSKAAKATTAHLSFDDDDVTASLLAAEGYILPKETRQWNVGERCMAKWSEDGQYYSASIEAITENGEVHVIFDAYKNRDTTRLEDLKEHNFLNQICCFTFRKGRLNQREYLKKKKQKKQQRFKEIEAEREVEKNKWLAFSSKSLKKSGLKPKSIFASPDNVNGRVGIGTCGMSGKPMTEFSHGEKYRKGV